MPRPQKNSADYFSHDADASDNTKIMIIEANHGLAAYAIFFKCIELLAKSDNSEIEEPDDLWFVLYSKKWGIEKTLLMEIFSDFFKDRIKLLQRKNGKVYSESLKRRLQPLVNKRKNMRAKYNGVSASEIPQRKENERKAKIPMKKRGQKKDNFETT
jgi:hypothetical protein